MVPDALAFLRDPRQKRVCVLFRGTFLKNERLALLILQLEDNVVLVSVAKIWVRTGTSNTGLSQGLLEGVGLRGGKDSVIAAGRTNFSRVFVESHNAADAGRHSGKPSTSREFHLHNASPILRRQRLFTAGV